MAVMPHDRQPRVAVATTPKEVASSGFVHEKGFHQTRHGDSPPNLPRDTMPRPTWSARPPACDYRPTESAPSPAWSAWPPGLRCSSPARVYPKAPWF